MLTKQLREMQRQAEVLEQNPKGKRKEAASLMTNTEPLARYWWASAKNELASKVFIKAKGIYKQNLKK